MKKFRYVSPFQTVIDFLVFEDMHPFNWIGYAYQVRPALLDGEIACARIKAGDRFSAPKCTCIESTEPFIL
jgi:hypothetical protein